MSSTAAAPESGWSSLPGDLLETILQLLPWSSHPRFAATCRHWRSAASPFYPAWLTPLLLNAADVGSTNVRYYSPYFHKNFEIADTLEMLDAQISCTNGHRLILKQRPGDEGYIVADVNLVTGRVYRLLPWYKKFDFVVYDGGERMFGVDTTGELETGRAIQFKEGKGWSGWEFSETTPVLGPSPLTNPVLHGGLLYLLGDDGRLAVHDDRRHEEGFRILEEPTGFGFECDESYLFESDEGELMAVLFGDRGTPVHIVRLNEQTMKWEKIDSLGGRALFTGTLTTMMVNTDVKWMQDKIFVPRLYDWPETVNVKLVDLHGELAFVPTSSNMVAGGGGRDEAEIWSCEFGHEEPEEFWETIKVDYSIWVDFKK
ncbi:hypothetical protein ACP4OV_024071 [Aristida adscensionis]